MLRNPDETVQTPRLGAIQQLNLHLQRSKVSATDKYLGRLQRGYPESGEEWFDAMAHLHLQVLLFFDLCSLYSEMRKNLMCNLSGYPPIIKKKYIKKITRHTQTKHSQIE